MLTIAVGCIGENVTCIFVSGVKSTFSRAVSTPGVSIVLMATKENEKWRIRNCYPKYKFLFWFWACRHFYSRGQSFRLNHRYGLLHDQARFVYAICMYLSKMFILYGLLYKQPWFTFVEKKIIFFYLLNTFFLSQSMHCNFFDRGRCDTRSAFSSVLFQSISFVYNITSVILFISV